MRRSKFSQEQIVAILNEHSNGLPVSQLSRKYNVAGATIYSWKSKYRDRPAHVEQLLKHLEEQNRLLKARLIDALIDNEALRDLFMQSRCQSPASDPSTSGTSGVGTKRPNDS